MILTCFPRIQLFLQKTLDASSAATSNCVHSAEPEYYLLSENNFMFSAKELYLGQMMKR